MRDARRRLAALALGLALAGALALAMFGGADAALDRLARLAPAPQPGIRVLVVDIGAVDDAGAAWDRRASARLAARIADAAPRAVGWDMVFSGTCAPDATNAALAAGFARVPTVLGFLLAGSGQPLAGPAPVLGLAGAPPEVWAAPGAEGPCPAFAASASLGAVSLIGDSGARVRGVPVAVQVGGQIWPGLAVELLRRAGRGIPVLGAATMRQGEGRFALLAPGQVRVRPSDAGQVAARTVAAADVLAGRVPPDRMAGALVLVGSSRPERGGLRPTVAGPLTPSVQIWADAVTGLAAGRLPSRPAHASVVEAAALGLGGVVLAALIVLVAPAPAFGLTAGLAVVWPIACVLLAQSRGLLFDPLGPPLILMAAALLALLLGAAATSRAERALRGRMRQLMPDAVVSRLAENPDLFRLKGEAREVTALFTDLEGFTDLTNRLPPQALIALLDRYFTTVSAQVLAHGGMIDKIVGDAVHALFNAPLDQPGHARAALDCAAAIVAATEQLRRDLPDLGRTRIGVETGIAILGDVGSAARIDYTAHGPAVNMAARLQEAAKTLGPPVIIGPGAAAAAAGGTRTLGKHPLRGFGMVEVFALATTPHLAASGIAADRQGQAFQETPQRES